jgi:hypothetical protein
VKNAAIYDKSGCEICGKLITENGFGYESHMRKHVRLGEAIDTSENDSREILTQA